MNFKQKKQSIKGRTKKGTSWLKYLPINVYSRKKIPQNEFLFSHQRRYEDKGTNKQQVAMSLSSNLLFSSISIYHVRKCNFFFILLYFSTNTLHYVLVDDLLNMNSS